MFKKSLIGSVLFHLLLFVGLELVPDRSDSLRTAHKNLPLIIAALDSDFPSETPILLKERSTGNDSQSKTDVRLEQPLLKVHRERITGLDVVEKTSSNLLTDSEKIKTEILKTEPYGYEVGEGSPNLQSSGLTENEIIAPAVNPQSLEDSQSDRLPVKIRGLKPEYPLKARQNNWEGVTVLKILIQADGKVGEATIIQSSGYELLDMAAVKAVKQWRYRPALKNGVAIAWQVRVRVKFMLE